MLARVVVTAVAAGLGIGPLVIDLNRTHATHPLWPGHARFHVVWQAVTLFLLSAVAIGLLWIASPLGRASLYMAAVLTAMPLAGFLVALATRRIYGGTLHDPQGIAPLRIGQLEIDLNTVVVVFAAVLLIAAVLIY